MADEAPVVEASPQPAQEPVNASAPTAGAEPAVPPEGTPTPEATPPKTFGQEEVDRIVKKRLAKEARRLERQIEERLRSELPRREPESRPTEAPKVEAQGKPVLKDFASYEDWVEAVSTWNADRRFEERVKAESERARKSEEAQIANDRSRYFQERVVEKGRDLYEDFEDVALNDKLPITDAMAITLAESDQGPVVAYYLGEHPEEAARISKLSPPNQVRELDKIAATLSKPAAPTKAPDPITPNAGNGSTAAKLESASMEDYIKIRRRQDAQARA